VDVIDRWTASEAGRAGGVMRITRRDGGARVELDANEPEPMESATAATAAAAATPLRMTFDFFNPAALPVST
jgi:hypothetical protein